MKAGNLQRVAASAAVVADDPSATFTQQSQEAMAVPRSDMDVSSKTNQLS